MAFPVSLGLATMAVAMIAAADVRAQALVDPTKPPAEFLGPASDRAASSAPVVGAGQIIILSSQRRQVTVNGQTTKLGARLGDATVVGISDSQLTIRSGGQNEKVDLYGGVHKRITNTGPPESKVPSGQGAAK